MGEPAFSLVEEREIAALLAHAPTPRSACADVLRAVQRHRRWIDDETLAAVAARLQMSPAEA
jgi:NADH:ubiquinone oxidoreductase subunit E